MPGNISVIISFEITINWINLAAFFGREYFQIKNFITSGAIYICSLFSPGNIVM